MERGGGQKDEKEDEKGGEGGKKMAGNKRGVVDWT